MDDDTKELLLKACLLAWAVIHDNWDHTNPEQREAVRILELAINKAQGKF